MRKWSFTQPASRDWSAQALAIRIVEVMLKSDAASGEEAKAALIVRVTRMIEDDRQPQCHHCGTAFVRGWAGGLTICAACEAQGHTGTLWPVRECAPCVAQDAQRRQQSLSDWLGASGTDMTKHEY